MKERLLSLIQEIGTPGAWRWAVILALFLSAWAIWKATSSFALKMVRRFVPPSPKLSRSLHWSLGPLVLGGVFKILLPFMKFQDPLLSTLSKALSTCIRVGIVMLAYQAVKIFDIVLKEKAHSSESKLDNIFVPLVSKTLKTAIILVGAIIIGQGFSLDMGGLIAGMGIGGIAFALAAKDTISNVFGSVTVLMDRPFKIGDWVKIGDNIEGVVERVGLRSTRIRTFYDSLITLPNGQLTSVHIDNYGQRTFRRLSTHIGVEYNTPPEKLEALCEGIRQIILGHPHTRKDGFQCYFHSFADSSLQLILYVFWKVPTWSAELAERHRLLLDILRLGHKLGVNFAFPTRTVHMFQHKSD